MKTFTLTLIAILWTMALFAQSPQAIKYQAVARDGAGNVLANKTVSIRISILQTSTSGSEKYSETHLKTTNTFGLVDLEIGHGTTVYGSFSGINWGYDDYFLKLEMDPNGGSSYQWIGTSQLLSVPYALFAKDVQNKDDADADSANELQKISISGTVLTLDKNGGSVTLPSSGGGDNWGTQTVITDATLSGNGTTSTPLKIADNGVNSSKIADGSIAAADLANSAIITDKINTGAVTGAKIAQASATSGQALKWNGTTWAPAADETGTGNATGPAGGDLTGTYPNPILGEGKVTSAKILDGTIASPDLANNAVTTDKIISGAVTGAKIAQASATSGQALKWNGTTWAPAEDETGTGNPTGPAGGDLTGTYPNPTLGVGKVTSANILDGHIASSDLASNIVTTDKINSGAVTGAKIAQASATSGQALKWNGTTWAPAADETGTGIPTGSAGGDLAGTYPNPTIGDGKVTSSKILDGTISAADLATNAVSTDKINAGAVTGAKIAQASATTGQALKWNGTTWAPAADETGTGNPTGPAGGDLTGTYPNPALGDGKVTTTKILDGSIAAADIANNAVTTDKINAGAVTGAKIAQASATSGQALKWNGTTWAPSDDAIALPYSGTGTSGSPLFDITNLGTSGAISTFSSGNYGIWGESGSSSGIGVYGVNKTSTGTTYGVFGDVYSPTGFSGYFQGGKFYIKGNTGIGTLDPSAKLEVSGQVKITGGSPGTGKVLTSDGVGLATWQTPEVNLWLKNSNHIYYNAGNVGIGLNNPAGMLEIYGNSIDSYPQLLLSETDGYARVNFRTMLASSKHWVLAGHTNQTDGDSQWHLNYFNGTEGKNIFSVYGNSNITFDGKVGIGTTAPGSLLQVHSNITYVNNVTPIIKISDNFKTWNIGLGDPGDRFSISSEDNKDRLTILKSNGFVGLGITAPSAGLHIKANSWPGSFIYLESNSGSDAGIRFYESTTPKWHIYNNAAAGGLQITNFAAQTAIFVKQSNSFVGIGTTNPEYILDVAGGINIIKGLSGAALLCNGSQAIWYNGTYFSWGYQGTHNYFANKVTIGNAANPDYMLYVQGNAYATGTWSSSDIRFKKNVTSIENALSGILRIRGTSFKFRKDEFKDYQFDEGTRFGFIAQDLEDVFPEVVKTESNGYKSVNYNGMIPVLVEAIKEQQKIINDLKYENEHLKTNNDQVEAKLKQLKTENESIIARLGKIEGLIGCNAKR